MDVEVSNNNVKGLEKAIDVLNEIRTIKGPEMDFDFSVICLGNLATRIKKVVMRGKKEVVSCPRYLMTPSVARLFLVFFHETSKKFEIIN